MKFKFWLYAGNLLRPRYGRWPARLLGLIESLKIKLPSVMLFSECDKAQIIDINNKLNNRYDFEFDSNGNAILWLKSKWAIDIINGRRVVRKKNLPNKLGQDRTIVLVKLRRLDSKREDGTRNYCWFASSHFSSSANFLKPDGMTLAAYKEAVKKERIAQAKYCADYLKDFRWLFFYVDQNSFTRTAGHPWAILTSVLTDWRVTLPECLNRLANSHHGYDLPLVHKMQDLDVIYHSEKTTLELDEPNTLVGKVLTHENKISDHHHFRLIGVVDTEGQKA